MLRVLPQLPRPWDGPLTTRNLRQAWPIDECASYRCWRGCEPQSLFDIILLESVAEYRTALRKAATIDRSFLTVARSLQDGLVLARTYDELVSAVARCRAVSDAATSVEHVFIGPCKSPLPSTQALVDQLARNCVNVRTWVSFTSPTCPLPSTVQSIYTGLADLPLFGILVGDTCGVTTYRATVLAEQFGAAWSITASWQLDALVRRLGQLRVLELNHVFAPIDRRLLDALGRLPCVAFA